MRVPSPKNPAAVRIPSVIAAASADHVPGHVGNVVKMKKALRLSSWGLFAKAWL
jgi:hypothetical protein